MMDAQERYADHCKPEAEVPSIACSDSESAPWLPSQLPLTKTRRALFTDGFDEEAMQHWPFSPTRLLAPCTPGDETDGPAAALLSPPLRALPTTHRDLSPPVSSFGSPELAALSVLSPGSDGFDSAESCASDTNSNGSESFCFGGDGGEDWIACVDPTTASASPPSARVSGSNSRSTSPPPMASPPARSTAHLQQRHASLALAAKLEAAAPTADDLMRAVSAPALVCEPTDCADAATTQAVAAAASWPAATGLQRDPRQSSMPAHPRRRPPCHPHMPSALDIAAFASLRLMYARAGDEQSEGCTAEGGECCGKEARQSNGKEARHGSSWLRGRLHCWGHDVAWNLLSSRRLMFVATLALLACTAVLGRAAATGGSSSSFGFGFAVVSPSSRCTGDVEWGLWCSFGWTAALLACQAAPMLQLPRQELGRLVRSAVFGGALLCFSALLLRLAQTLTWLAERRPLASPTLQAHARLKALFPELQPQPHQAAGSTCWADDSFELLCRGTLALHAAQWSLALMLLLLNQTQRRRIDSPHSFLTPARPLVPRENSKRGA